MNKKQNSTLISVNFNFKEFSPTQINPGSTLIQANEQYSIYRGFIDEIGDCSLITLHNIVEYNTEFNQMLSEYAYIHNQIFNENQNVSQYFLKLHGYTLVNNKFTFILDPVDTSLYNEVFKKSLSYQDKTSLILDMMEILLNLHELKIPLIDMKPSSVFVKSYPQPKIQLLFPIGNLHLFKEDNYDDEIIDNLNIDPSEILLRYTPPERLLEVPVFHSVNNIWSLGCLLVEIFSQEKVWEGFSQNEIIHNLKSLSIPKIPKDIPQIFWGIICECLNPFYKTRPQIKEIIFKFYLQLKKINTDKNTTVLILINRIIGMELMKETLTTLNMSYMNINDYNITCDDNTPQKPITNYYDQECDGKFYIGRCKYHPKMLVGEYCPTCTEPICDKCKQGEAHRVHLLVTKPISDLVTDAQKQIGIFLDRFNNFVEESSQSFPIDDSIFVFINKQRSIIKNIYDEQINHIEMQFEIFMKKINELKEIEKNFLKQFNDYFNEQLNSFEGIVKNLSKEIQKIQNDLAEQIKDFQNFKELNTLRKTTIISNIHLTKDNLKASKNSILSKFKDYQRSITFCDKIKRYFHHISYAQKESKVYNLLSVFDKYKLKLQDYYNSINLQDYLQSISGDLDNFALINSRNYLPENVDEIYIACFNSQSIISFSISQKTKTIKNIDFPQILPTNHFLNYSRSLNVNGLLYINGGFDEVLKNSYKTHLIYNPKSNKLVQGQDMIYGHGAHSIMFIPPNYIVAVSGSSTAKCERYDISNNTWVEIAEVNYHRQNSSMFFHNEQHIYIFGGLRYDTNKNDFRYVDTVERIDIGFGDYSPNQKWEIIPTIKGSENIKIDKSAMSVIPIHHNKILLVGGIDKDNNFSDDVILFDFEKSEFTFCDDLRLEKKTCFPGKSFLFKGQSAYQFDNEGDVHEFDMKEFTFKVVEVNNIE